MATVLIMEDVPKLKLTAYSNSTFRQFIPITVDGVVPADLGDYTWQAHIQDDKLHPTDKLFAMTCTASDTGVWIVAAENDLDGLFDGQYVTAEKRTVYGNLLYNPPGNDFSGVYCPAATIEMVVKAGATSWT